MIGIRLLRSPHIEPTILLKIDYKQARAERMGSAYERTVDSSGKKMNKTLAATNKTAIPLTKSILKLSHMFKLMLIRMAMRTAIKAAKRGSKI